MPRKATGNQRIRITITTSKEVNRALGKLVKLGLHGNTIAEAAERLVCEGLYSDMKWKRRQLMEK